MILTSSNFASLIRSKGMTMAKAAGKRTTVVVPDEMDKAISKLAKDEFRPWTQQVVILLREALVARNVKLK